MVCTAAGALATSLAIMSTIILFVGLMIPQWSYVETTALVPSPLSLTTYYIPSTTTLHVGIWGVCLEVANNQSYSETLDPNAIYTCGSLYDKTIVQVNCTNERGLVDVSCTQLASFEAPNSLCGYRKEHHWEHLNWHQLLQANDTIVDDIKWYLNLTCGNKGRIVVGMAVVTMTMAVVFTVLLLLETLLCVCYCMKGYFKVTLYFGSCACVFGLFLLGVWRTEVPANSHYASTIYFVVIALLGIALATYSSTVHRDFIFPPSVRAKRASVGHGSVYVDWKTGMHILVEDDEVLVEVRPQEAV